jgi:CubicO group peptidase (beta-lactamase class C family)
MANFARMVVVAAVLAAPPLAQSQDPISYELTQTILQLAQQDLHARSSSEEPAPDVDGPITALPPPQDLLLARMNVWLNPAYWSTWVREALINGNVQIPAPTDIVRPEIWTPNVTVEPGSYISSLPLAIEDLAGLSYEWDGAQKTLLDFMHTTETDMVQFAVNGEVIGALYNNGYAEHTRHQPWSVTKTFVAATVGIAYDRGLVSDLQQPIEDYIPELVGTAWEGVSIENILQMESGVHWDEDTPVLVQNTQVQQWVAVLLDSASNGALGQTRNEFLMSLPKVYEQGTEFRYNSGNTQVLAWMLEKIYDQPYNEVISELLWKPMGAYGDARMIADREGSVIASQGLYARGYDFVRFGELLRNRGLNTDGQRILSAEWVDKLTQMTEVSGGGYAYQTWNSDVSPDAYKASGFQGQKITVVPSACMTAVRMSHSFGLDYREGDDPFDPNAYGVSTNFSSDEWVAVVQAMVDQRGGCNGAATALARAEAGVNPAAGGALNAWSLLLAALGLVGLGRRRPAALSA